MREREEIIIDIVNTYLSRYGLDTESLDYYIKNVLLGYCSIYDVEIDEIKFQFQDGIASNTVAIVAEEINEGETYDFSKMNFKPGDVVIDIGGNVGIVSIYLAKKYPFLKIYAYEPVKQNYDNFVSNIKLNNIPDGVITVHNMAVTGDGRDINMNVQICNSGGSTVSSVCSMGSVSLEDNCGIKSTTLTEIIESNNIEQISLLKMDCEGSEYEIVYNTDPKYLQRIKRFRGELHENKDLTDKYDADKLSKYIKQYINNIKVIILTKAFVA